MSLDKLQCVEKGLVNGTKGYFKRQNIDYSVGLEVAVGLEISLDVSELLAPLQLA